MASKKATRKLSKSRKAYSDEDAQYTPDGHR